jgi:hypothetical protein
MSFSKSIHLVGGGLPKFLQKIWKKIRLTLQRLSFFYPDDFHKTWLFDELWNRSVPKYHLRKNRNLYNIIFSIFYSTFLGRAERLGSARNLEQLVCSQGINHCFLKFTLHKKSLKFFPSRFVMNFLFFEPISSSAKVLMKQVFSFQKF